MPAILLLIDHLTRNDLSGLCCNSIHLSDPFQWILFLQLFSYAFALHQSLNDPLNLFHILLVELTQVRNLTCGMST